MIDKNKCIIIIISFFVTMPNLAYGYIEPGTGSYILSFIIAFFVGILVYIRSAFTKIIEIFNKLINKNKNKNN